MEKVYLLVGSSFFEVAGDSIHTTIAEVNNK